jgi:hypothetical protein
MNIGLDVEPPCLGNQMSANAGGSLAPNVNIPYCHRTRARHLQAWMNHKALWWLVCLLAAVVLYPINLTHHGRHMHPNNLDVPFVFLFFFYWKCKELLQFGIEFFNFYDFSNKNRGTHFREEDMNSNF